jgi:hypothetical protein
VYFAVIRILFCYRQLLEFSQASDETMEAIRAAMKNGTSKAALCRTFGVKRSTLYDALTRQAQNPPLNSTDDRNRQLG